MNIKRYKIIVSATALCLIMVFAVFGQTQKTQEAQLLSANQTIERELAGGQSHTYRITLKSNEFLQIKAEQKSVNVVVRLFDSNQKQLVEVNSSHTTWFEELLFITEKEGEYEIQISALQEKAATGKYTLQWSKQNATEKNRTRLNAKKLYDDGLKLFYVNESEAITKFKEALKLYQDIGDLQGELNSLDYLSSLSYPDYKTVREYLNQALSISRKLGDKSREADLLSSLGVTFIDEEPQKALEYYNQALSISRNSADKIEEPEVLEYIAQIYESFRNYQKAIEYYNQALSLYRTVNSKRAKSNIVQSLDTLSRLYEKLGDKQKALNYQNEAKLLEDQLSDESRITNIVATFLINLKVNACEFFKARDYQIKVGDYQKCIEDLKQALAVAPSAGIPRVVVLTLIEMLIPKLGDKEKEIEYLNEILLLARAEKHQGFEALTLWDLGDSYRKLGENQKAFDFYNQSLIIEDSDVNRLNQIINFLASVGNPQLAVVYGKQAINVIQQVRSKIKELDKETQKAFLKSNEPIYRKVADILISEGRFPEAQAVLDLLKEEEFKQIVRRSGEPLFTLPYSRAEEAVIKVVDRLASLGRELSDLKAKTKDSLTAEETKRISEIESIEIPAANKALRQAIEALSTAAPDVKNALDLRIKDNIQNILPALGKGVVALYTVVGKTTADEDSGVKANNNAQAKSVNSPALNKSDNKTDNNKTGNQKINVGWILLVTPEFRKAYPIDTNDLEQTVFKFREALRSPLYDPQPVAQELYKKLFLQTSEKQKTTLAADLETYLGKQKDKTLMWSLDGVLRYVPMAALHDGKGYLVEKYRNVVFNTASLGSLKDLPKPNWEVIGLGVSTKATVKAYDGRTVNFWALKDSESELNAIIKEKNRTADVDGLFPGTLKINNDFTKEALFEGARTGMPVMHISTHFWFNPAQEDTSFLLLGNGGRLQITEFQDYPQLFSNVDFLSLSACDTATGGNANNTSVTGKADTEQKARESNGKEIEGLAYVAQTLGAKSVMASLWQVSDTGTKELMLKFYQIRKEQPELPKGEALRQAQLSLLHRTNKVQAVEGGAKGIDLEVEEKNAVEGLKPFKKDGKIPLSHPYYWSSFILIGNWR
jgi:CHAT domain-containing protein/Tfp pilus assembly protein PilF